MYRVIVVLLILFHSPSERTRLGSVHINLSMGVHLALSVLDIFAYIVLLCTAVVWPLCLSCCERGKRDTTTLAKDSKTSVSAGEPLSKEKGGGHISVLGIGDSSKVRSRGENGAKSKLMEMPTQRSELDSESTFARRVRNDGSKENVEATQVSEAVSVNDYILKAAADNVVIHPGLVKMKGNIDQSTFHVKTKEEIMQLEEAMQSDRVSEHEKSQEQAKVVATTKPAPAIKWGDAKSVLFETTSQLTFDDDEIVDEPDLYH